MRTLAIGDIHGCRTALETLITTVNPSAADRFIFLGDYVNRGPDSCGVIEYLVDFRKRHQCVFLRGNHEVMTIDARGERITASSWLLVNRRDALQSYGFTGQGDAWTLIPEKHWDFLANTRRYFETERHIFVHGALDPDLNLDEQPDSVIFWDRFETIRPHKSGKKIIVGHTPMRDGEIRDVGFAACIDTGCVLGKWLTALDVESGRFWQANQKGASRTGECPAWND
jgi:serine/threonine protein phosphatase 1